MLTRSARFVFGMCTVLALASFAVASVAQPPATGIRALDFKAYLLARGELGKQLRRECGRVPAMTDVRVTYARLLGTVDEQAIVEATTCAMGNGGADIVEVFRLMPDGKLVSLKIDDGERPEDLYEGSRWTPRLEARKNVLVRWFVKSAKGSTLAEGAPLTRREISYRWEGSRFVIASVVDVPEPALR